MAIKKMKVKKTGSTTKSKSVKYATAKPTQKRAAVKARKPKTTVKKISKRK